ncbi:MAG: hypothetical protein RDV48_09950 [Candidatus Eremiobacteraeota bacterium]|nr:hypothetical protein [Candidatus Eremiobacteraeota bacterium]
MKRFPALFLLVLLTFAALPAGARTIPLEKREDFQKEVTTRTKETSNEKITSYYYRDILIEEVFEAKGVTPPAPGTVKTSWEDKAARWEKTEREGATVIKRTVIYKREMNQAGNMAGKKLDDLFSQDFIFDYGWDFGSRRVLARIIGGRHFLQLLVISSTQRVIEKEFVLSEQELDVHGINAIEALSGGKKLCVHMQNADRGAPWGSLFILDPEGGKVFCAGKGVTEYFISPKQAFMAMVSTKTPSSQGRGTVQLLDVLDERITTPGEVEAPNGIKSLWTPEERFLYLVLEKDSARSLARVNTFKKSLEVLCGGVQAITLSPSGRRAVIARPSEKYAGWKLKGIDRGEGKLLFITETGGDEARTLFDAKDFTTLSLLDTDRKTESSLCKAACPDLQNALWSEKGDSIIFFDVNGLFSIDTGRKNTSKTALAGPFEYRMSLPEGSYYPLGRGNFLLLWDSRLYFQKGMKGRDILIDKVDSFAMNESGTLLAYLSKADNGFRLTVYDLKNREQIPLFHGERKVQSYRWHGQTIDILRIVLNPGAITSDEPVVIQFDEKGDAVPLSEE